MNKERIMGISKSGILFALHVGELCMDSKGFLRFKKLLLDHLHKEVEPKLRQELEACVSEAKEKNHCEPSR